MNEVLVKLEECVERGKINLASPFPPALKGQTGADELTREALDSGISAEARIWSATARTWST